MTLIIYIKCKDATIILSDRKETDDSSFGQSTKKYYLPTNQEFVLSLAGDSTRIDTIVSDLHIDQDVTRDTIRRKLYDIVENSPNISNDLNLCNGLLLIKDGTSFQFNNVMFTNHQKSIVEVDLPFKCYGEGAVLVDYLIRKFNFMTFSSNVACQHLIGIVQDVSKRIDSVGSINDYGIDLLVFTDDGELKKDTIYDDGGIDEIKCNCEYRDDHFMSLFPKIEDVQTPAKPKPTFKKNIKKIQIHNNVYSITYQINGGEIESILPDERFTSLLISLCAIDDGELTITLPRELLDSKMDNEDDDFIIISGGQEVKFHETPTEIDRTISVSFKKDCKEIEIIGTIMCKIQPSLTSLDESSKESGIENISKLVDTRKTPITIQTDKNAYPYGSYVIVTIFNSHFTLGTSITLEITNEAGKTVYGDTIPVSADAKGTCQIIVDIKGKNWLDPGSKYRIKALCRDETAECDIWISSDPTIELDQKVYSWKDKVYITVISPKLARNSKSLAEIGDKRDSSITISTSRGSLNKYKLTETENDTGIFVGEIQLSGFSNEDTYKNRLDTPNSGKTFGSGPANGIISCLNKDKITVNLVTPTRTVSASAPIRWNVGEISWMKANFSASGEGEIRIFDPDMSLEPDKINKFKIRIFSDTDPVGIKLTITETGKNTGIFKNTVKFTTDAPSKAPVLQVSDDDAVTAEYVDKTLPEPYSINSEIRITATALIGSSTVPPLDRIQLSNLRILDKFNEPLSHIEEDQDVLISADLINMYERKQKFAFIAQIENHGVTYPPMVFSGELAKGQSNTPKLVWRPDCPGKYTVTVFVWESFDRLTALCSPTQLNIMVETKTNSKNLVVGDTWRAIPSRSPIRPIVSIPLGSNFPGCEDNHECYVPYEITVKVNQTIIWNNDDDAAHTVTSGTPDLGSDGNFDSGLIAPKSSFSHKFVKKGTYRYFCIVHPWQEGIVIVK